MWEELFFIPKKRKAFYDIDSALLDGISMLLGLFLLQMANFQDNLKQISLYDNILNICSKNTHILINLISFLVNIDRVMLLQNCFEDKEIMNEVMPALWTWS